MNDTKTPLTTLKQGDRIFIVWDRGVEVAVLDCLDTYRKGDIVWPHANVAVTFKGKPIIRKVAQEQLFCTAEEADAEFILSCQRSMDRLNKILEGRDV